MGTPSIITALKDKAQIVRDIAGDMNLAFTENAVEDRPELVRFVFEQDFPNSSNSCSPCRLKSSPIAA
jgi:hypothetical protein